MRQTTQFPNLRKALRAGGEVFVYRGAASIDVSLNMPKRDDSPATPITGSSFILSDCLIEFERHLGGDPTVRPTNHPIDSLPRQAGSDLKLKACGNGRLSLSVIGWSDQQRAEFTASTVERVLAYADQHVGNPRKRAKMYPV